MCVCTHQLRCVNNSEGPSSWRGLSSMRPVGDLGDRSQGGAGTGLMLTLGVFLSHSLYHICCSEPGVATREPRNPSVFSLSLRVTETNHPASFLHGCWDPNSGPHAWAVNSPATCLPFSLSPCLVTWLLLGRQLSRQGRIGGLQGVLKGIGTE